MATISITREIVFTEEDLKKIKQSAPTKKFLDAIKKSSKPVERPNRTEGRFDAYLRWFSYNPIKTVLQGCHLQYYVEKMDWRWKVKFFWWKKY